MANWTAAYVCLLLQLVPALSAAFCSTSLLRLLESNICRRHYLQVNPSVIRADGGVPEMVCKDGEVQSLLSSLQGLGGMLNIVPTLLAALPFIVLSRLVDRRVVLLLNLLGSFLGDCYAVTILYFYDTFDPRLIWLQGVFMFIGGGSLVFKATVQAIVVEAIPASSLTSFYLYSSAIFLATNLFGAGLGIQLMKITPWLAVGVGLLCEAGTIPLLLLFDEELPPRQSSPSHTLTDGDALEYNKNAGNFKDNNSRASWVSETLKLRKRGSQLLSSLRTNFTPLAVIAVYSSGDSLRLIKSPWLSTRYFWPLHHVASIELCEGVFTAVLLAVLPHLEKWLFRSQGSGVPLRLLKFSLAASIAGTILLGFAFSGILALIGLTVLACGAGFQDALMAFIASGKESREDISQTYLAVYIVQSLSSAFSGAAMGAFYSNLVRQDSFLGMAAPFWVCAALFCVTRAIAQQL